MTRHDELQAVAEPCGHCDRCEEHAAAGTPAETTSSALPPEISVRHRQWGDGVVISGEDDRVTVLFDDYGYRTLVMDVVEDSDILEVLPRTDG